MFVMYSSPGYMGEGMSGQATISLSDRPLCSQCLMCDGGLSPGPCCEITELDWNPYIQEDCICQKQRPTEIELTISYENPAGPP